VVLVSISEDVVDVIGLVSAVGVRSGMVLEV
jgi:hypothetical protein